MKIDHSSQKPHNFALKKVNWGHCWLRLFSLDLEACWDDQNEVNFYEKITNNVWISIHVS